jgi:colicin import membrane protein
MAEATTEVLISPEKYGLSDETAKSITKDLPQILSEREILVSQYNEVIQMDINEPKTLKMANELRKQIKKNRTDGIEKWHKVNKEYFLKAGQFLDAIKRKEIFENERMEEALEQIEKHFENLEKKRIEDLHLSRLELIKPYTEDTTATNFGTMEQDVFDAYLSAKKQAYETKLEQQRLAELERIEKERLEAERIEAQRIENEKLKAERERLEQEAKKREAEMEAQRKQAEEKARIEKEKADKILAEQKAIADAERKRIELENEAKLKAEREERERLEAELKAKREAEERLTKEKAEVERKAKMESDKLAKAPIKKQAKIWVESFVLPTAPIENPAINVITQRFEQFKKWATEQVESI